MCDKAVNTHSPTIKYVPKCYKTQEMCNKAANFIFGSIPGQYKTQEICDIILFLHFFSSIFP